MTDTVTRALGRSGIEVSQIGLGCWAIGGDEWPNIDDAESIRAIHAGLDAGINFLDTADRYGFGHSERQIAKATSDRRDKVVIATKFSIAFDEDSRQVTGMNASADYIKTACENSLLRLKTDYIDLYQFHWNDYPAQDAEQVLDVLEELVSAGKIRSYGWSTDFPDRAEAFAQGKNCTAIQAEFNVLNDNAGVAKVCEQANLALINRGPLAMGLLSGKYTPTSQLPDDDVRGPTSPPWVKYFKEGRPNPEWFKKTEVISEILKSNGRTLAQGALAWLWARSEKCIPIPGFRNSSQVLQNAKAMSFGPLTPEDLAEIDKILER